MRLYIDKENLLSLLRQGQEEEMQESYDEVIRLIKRQLHLVYNFSKQEAIVDPLIKVCLDKMSRGRCDNEGIDKFSAPPFPDRPIRNNFRTNQPWDIFTSAFLVNDERVENLRQGKSVLIGNVGEEIELISTLFCNSLFELHSLYNIQDRSTFTGWETLENDGHIMPCSDIVVADRYLFQKPDNVLDKNIFAILKMFAKERENQKTNILFFTDKIEEEQMTGINRKIATIFGRRPGAKVTFVHYGNNRPHDRFILTNYRLFRSGDSFNYFNERGHLDTRGLTLDVDSLASSNICSVVAKMRSDLQNLCDRADGRIFGAKESNFIKFN